MTSRARALATLSLWAAAGAPFAARADRVAFLHTPPAAALAGRALELSGNIFGTGNLAKARCRYRVQGESWKQVDLQAESGDLYRAVIPGRDVAPPLLEYYCVAFDYFGAQTELYASPAAPRRVRVAGDGPPEARASRAPEERRPEADRPPPRRHSEPDPERPSADAAAEPRPAPRAAARRPPRDDELALFGAEDVVSLASRQAQSVAEAPAIATGVSEEQMRALGLRTLPDVLQIIPGFDVSRDVQGFYRVAIRGMRDDAALLFLYDGHRLNSPYDARALWNLSTETLERVEAIRGPGSALYGSGALLGVVDVVSKRREGLEASVSGGSFGTVDAHASGGARLAGDLALFADAGFSHQTGYRAAVASDAASATMQRLGLQDAGAPSGDTNDEGTLVNVGLELRYGRPGGSLTRLSARFLREDRAALIGLFDTLGHDSRLQWNVLLADLWHEIPIGPGTLTLRAWADQQSTDRLFQIEPQGFPFNATTFAAQGLFQRTATTAQSAGLEAAVDLNVSQSHKLSLGLSGGIERLPDYRYELNFDQGQVYPRDQQVVPQGYRPRQAVADLTSRVKAAAFAQDVWRILPGLSLTLGVRLDALRLPDAVALDANGNVSSVTTHFLLDLDPRVGLVFSPAEGWNFKLLYGRALRAPTIQELTERLPTNDFTAGQFEGNPNLKPATIDTLEAGAETATAVGDNKVRLRANAFFNSFSDPITAVDTNGNIIPLSNRNLGVRVWGAEAEVRFEISSRAYTSLDYAWFRANDLASPQGFQDLTDVPQYRFIWATVVPLGRLLNLSVLAELGAERRNDVRSKLEALRPYRIPAYALVGAQLRTETLFDHLELAVQAHNLFDYPQLDDVPRPDRVPGLLPRGGFGAYALARARY